MEFFVFNNYTVYLEEILEKQNGQKNGEGTDNTAESYKNQASKQYSSSVSKAKSLMKKH